MSIALLESVLDKLSERDRVFAKSLIDQSRSRTLSDKQMYWVNTLAKRVNNGPVSIASDTAVKGIIDLINRNNKAKYPAIRVLVNGQELKLTKAGDKARCPGSINVISSDKVWLGRIQLTGSFEPSNRSNLDTSVIVDALKALAANPEYVAREYGKKTGRCCFCGLGLNDERSLLMGYGPVCAENYQLSWGDRPHDNKLETLKAS